MQLNMTAPADLDNEDRALGGEEEVFDLGEGEKEVSRGGLRSALGDVVRDQDGLSESEEEDAAEADVGEEDVYDSEEERELKLSGLEGELDELYDQYRERMSERDAKWRVKQARMKDRNQDAWHGIQGDYEPEDGVDKGYRDGMVRAPRRDGGDEHDGDESEEGGWDVVAAGKAKLGEEINSSDEEEKDEDEDENPIRRKVRFRRAVVPTPVKSAGNLVTSLQDGETRAQMSRQAQLWFAQPVFKGLDDLMALDDEDEAEGEEGGKEDEMAEDTESDDNEDADGDVEMEETLMADDAVDGGQVSWL